MHPFRVHSVQKLATHVLGTRHTDERDTAPTQRELTFWWYYGSSLPENAHKELQAPKAHSLRDSPEIHESIPYKKPPNKKESRAGSSSMNNREWQMMTELQSKHRDKSQGSPSLWQGNSGAKAQWVLRKNVLRSPGEILEISHAVC